MEHIKWIWQVWKEEKRFLILLFFITLLSTFVTVAYPFVFKILFDNLNKILNSKIEIKNPMVEIYRIVYFLLGVGIVRIFSGMYPTLRAFMNYRFENKLRMKYFSYILKKDYSFFNNFRTGDLVTRLTDDLSDFPKICWFLCSGIFRALDSSSKIFFCLVVMFFLNWKLTLLSVLPIPLMVLFFYLLSSKLYLSFKMNQEAISEINNQLEMSFSGIKIIKSYNKESQYNRFFEKALNIRMKTEIDLIKLNSLINLVYEYIDRIAQIVVILYGGMLVLKGEISVGTFYAFYTYLSILIYPVLDLPQLFVSGKQSFVNIDRLEEIKDYPVKIYNSNKNLKIDKIENIEFENVSFGYNQKNLILENLSFKFNKGEKIIIVGQVGAGKSTLLNLLSGFLIPTSGRILINGIPFEDIDLKSYREKVGFVLQEPLLFSGTLKENILFGVEDYEKDYYEKVLKIINMEDEIKRFLLKDETLVGQRGTSLSGGQKQRISIARALMKKPELLIFDDITSSLDTGNEKKLWDSLKEFLKESITIVVSHRLATIKYMDKVIFLNQQHAKGCCSHNELYKNDLEYKIFIDKEKD
ncbi:MAG: ABC transporter ATP-binding protein [candidate division WOR-3 bacterium]